MANHTSKILAAGLLAVASGASAQNVDMSDFRIEAGVSTLGVYIAPDVEVARNFHLRSPIYFFSYSGDVEYDGETGSGELDVFSFHLMGDYYIMNTGLRLSGGVSFGGYELNANYANGITINGVDYNANLTGNLQQKNNIAPVLALGYNHTFKNNWGFSAELGARITALELTATGQEALQPVDRDRFNREISDINDDLESIGVVPFLSLGVSYQF